MSIFLFLNLTGFFTSFRVGGAGQESATFHDLDPPSSEGGPVGAGGARGHEGRVEEGKAWVALETEVGILVFFETLHKLQKKDRPSEVERICERERGRGGVGEEKRL